MQLIDPDLPAGISERVLVVHNDRLVHDESFGDADANFALLCISKPLFAFAALHLMQQLNTPKLDDEIYHLLPELDERFAGITFRNLLTHSTGIERDATPGRWTQGRYLRWIGRSAVNRGRPIRYSVMTSWFLLGRALEVATGLSCGDILQRFALEPCGSELSIGKFEDCDRPLPVLDLRTGEPSAALWWADDAEVAAHAWIGTGVRGRIQEVLRIVSVLASRPQRASLQPSCQAAIDLLERPVGDGLSTDGRGLHAFGYSHGAFTGHRWLGLPSGREGFGSDSGTGSFILADPTRSLAVVYLSNADREPVTGLAKRRRLLSRVYGDLESRMGT